MCGAQQTQAVDTVPSTCVLKGLGGGMLRSAPRASNGRCAWNNIQQLLLNSGGLLAVSDWVEFKTCSHEQANPVNIACCHMRHVHSTWCAPAISPSKAHAILSMLRH